MFFTHLNFYILLSLSFRFNCSWNFVSLWLWVALDLSFFFFSGNFVGLWMWVACCSGFKFFFFVFVFFFFLCRFPRFLLLTSYFVNHEIFLITFSFPFFSVCNFYWIFGFLGFFYLVLILGLF